jgi:hypothetical protein
MGNNNFRSSDSGLYNVQCHKGETHTYMISGETIKHIHTLIEYGENNETPKWDMLQIIMSASFSIAMTALSFLISIFFVEKNIINNVLLITLWVCLIIGVVIGVVTLCLKWKENKNYKSFTSKIKDLLSELKEQELVVSQGVKNLNKVSKL